MPSTFSSPTTGTFSAAPVDQRVGARPHVPTLPQYWPGLDGLRTMAFSLVFFHHMGAVPGFAQPAWLAGCVQSLISHGWLGVDLFFVISGFLMTTILAGERERFGKIFFKQFYARRALRIWPAYFSVLAVAFFVVPFVTYAHWTAKSFGKFLWTFAPSLVLFFANFTVLKDVMGLWKLCISLHVPYVASLISPLWSLCIEEQFYLFLPLALSLVVAARARFSMFAAVMALSVGCRYAIQHFWPGAPHDTWYRNSFAHFDPLMIGCTVALLNQRFGWFSFARQIWPIVFAGSAICIFSFDMLAAQPAVAPLAVLVIAIGFGGLLTLGCSTPLFSRILAWKPVSEIGKKTYAMYLWHCFVIALMANTVFQPSVPESTNGWLIRATLSFIGTWIFALTSWRFIELPFHRLKSRFEPKKSSALAAVCVAALLAVAPVHAKAARDASPKECYTSYNQALYYAKDIKGIISYFTRARQAQLKGLAPAAQMQEFKGFRTWYVSSPKFVSEKITGNKAHLVLKGTAVTGDKPYTATVNVDMAREDNYWRVDSGSITGVVQL